MIESLIPYKLQKIRAASNKAKEEHKPNFRVTRLLDNFYFNEPILNTPSRFNKTIGL